MTFNAGRRGRGNYAAVAADERGTYATSDVPVEGSCALFWEFFLKPQGRKIQNFVYLVAMAVMLGVGVNFVDTTAAFQMYEPK